MINICTHCLKENGHTPFCQELKAKPFNTLFTVGYHFQRAVLSNYKAQMGEPNKYLVPMWEKSAIFWCEGAARLIEKAVVEGRVSEIQMANA